MLALCLPYILYYILKNPNNSDYSSDPTGGSIMFLVLFASCVGPCIYMIFHFSWPYNYEDKYLRVLFRISFYWSIVAVILTCIGPIVDIIFTGPTFIFLLVMYIVKIIKPKYAKNNIDQNSLTTSSSDKTE